MAPVFGAHGQAMGPADNGAGIVHEAGAVFQKGKGAEGIGMPGFVPDAAPQVRCPLLQGQGQGHGFDGIDRKVNPAAVAGAAFGTGNVVLVPLNNPVAAFIHIDDQILIFFERLQINSI